MRFGLAVGVAALISCIAGCGGDEFSADGAGGTGGAVAGGGSTGGAAGSGAVGGVGGIAELPGGGGVSATGGAGGAGGVAGSGTGATGGSGGSGGLPVWPDCGPPPQGQPKFYTTLDDYASIQTPSVGDGTNADANPDNDFHGGKCGTAIQIDGAGEFIQFRVANNLDLKKGSLDFWFRPAWDKYDGKVHNFFSTSNLVTGGIRMLKEAAADTNVIAVYLTDGLGTSHKTSVTPDNYNLVQNQWIRITMFWSFDSPGPNVALWFDKVAVQNYLTTTTGPKTAPLVASPTATFFIGANGTDDPDTAGGLLDEFKIYTFGLNPI